MALLLQYAIITPSGNGIIIANTESIPDKNGMIYANTGIMPSGNSSIIGGNGTIYARSISIYIYYMRNIVLQFSCQVVFVAILHDIFTL